jgi:Spy/CpxP family protein refolding chaperone
MKKIDRNFKLLVVIMFVLGLPLSAMSQPQHRRPIPHQSIQANSGFQFLDLTEEQKDQIKQIHLAHMKDVQPLKDELKINRAKVNALLKNDDPDMEKIVSLVEADGKLLTQIQVKSIEQKIKVRSLLTDEQKIIFDAHSEQMGERRAMAQHYGHSRFSERDRF